MYLLGQHTVTGHRSLLEYHVGGRGSPFRKNVFVPSMPLAQSASPVQLKHKVTGQAGFESVSIGITLLYAAEMYWCTESVYAANGLIKSASNQL
jgi:hypothetical protein